MRDETSFPASSVTRSFGSPYLFRVLKKTASQEIEIKLCIPSGKDNDVSGQLTTILEGDAVFREMGYLAVVLQPDLPIDD